MHLINSFAVVAALAAAPYVSTRSLAVEQFIAEGQSLVQRHTSLNARQSLANLPTCAVSHQFPPTETPSKPN